MIGIKSFEDVVRALLKGDKIVALTVVEKEIELAKNKGHHGVVMRLRGLLRDIADGESSSGFGAASYRNVPQTPSSMLNNSTLYEISSPDIDLEDVILSHENEEAVNIFLDEWKHQDSLLKHGLSPSNRLLLYGSPGTGKTKLANAIAHKLNYPLISVYLDELISSYLGNTGKNIREIFGLASKGNRIIFLDEIDAIAKHRGDTQDTGELKRVVTVFLQNIDKLPNNSIVIGATNHEELLDRAIWRRFPIRLNLDLPDHHARVELFKLFLEADHEELNLQLLANLSTGFSGSAIEDICRNVLKKSVINKSEASTAEAIRSVMLYNANNLSRTGKVHWKKEFYEAAQHLKDTGYTLREIESISRIPYTTLREHVR